MQPPPTNLSFPMQGTAKAAPENALTYSKPLRTKGSWCNILAWPCWLPGILVHLAERPGHHGFVPIRGTQFSAAYREMVGTSATTMTWEFNKDHLMIGTP